MRELDPALFSYHLLSPRAASGAQRAHLAEAYAAWRAVWGETLRELDGAERVFSDDFSRQHELGCLFYANQCVGLTGYRWVDLTRAENRDDSYFKVWPAAVLKQVLASGTHVCVGSNLTVLPSWRGMPGGYSIKEVLMTLAVTRFLASEADSMVGTMRNDRGMNGLVYRLGARPVLQDIEHHGVRVDLVVFSRRELGPVSPGAAVDALTRRLWCELREGRQHEDRAG